MNKEEFYLLNRAYNRRIGRSNVMYGESHLSRNAKTVNDELVQKDYVDENGEATVEGISQLERIRLIMQSFSLQEQQPASFLFH